MLEPTDCPGLVYFLPTPKSPHGVDVDPTGEYIVAGGKLATVIPVHSFCEDAQGHRGQGVRDGESTASRCSSTRPSSPAKCKNPGLGPLHTEFDGKGYAYTSAFISSEIVKWKLGTWEVVDRIPAYYSIGHLMIPGGDSEKPWGKYLVALNKITKDRYLPTGPELTHSAQLIDITGDKMKLLLDFPTHGRAALRPGHPGRASSRTSRYRSSRSRRTSIRTRSRAESEARVERDGNEVHVYMTTIRTHFAPDNIEGLQVGDKVYFHVTNLEQDWDVPHGFAVMGARTSELLVMPGETRTLVWEPQKPGVYPFYCTDFCSALHQEMQGYVRVSARGSNTPLAFGTGGG